MKSKIANCLICESEQLRNMKGYEKDHLVTCEMCSFVFSNMKPSQEELDKVYGGYSREVARTETTLQKMGEVALGLKNLSKAKRVIDIGCGDGEFLSIFKGLGCEVFGTEYDPRTEEICRNKGITMLQGGVMPSLGGCENPERFDLVVFTEVIEHINNPIDVIENISHLLKRDGLLYVTTPNFASLERWVLRAQWGMICYPEHISFYSPGTLNAILRRCGYEKVSLRTENISVFRIIQFLNRRKVSAGSNSHRDSEKVAAAAQTAVQNSFVLLFIKKIVNAILDVTGTGTSLIAVYRKVGN
ncbi:MAG: class I SAM-dependent methyltransferase [Burkholderiaceae bacterium]